MRRRVWRLVALWLLLAVGSVAYGAFVLRVAGWQVLAYLSDVGLVGAVGLVVITARRRPPDIPPEPEGRSRDAEYDG